MKQNYNKESKKQVFLFFHTSLPLPKYFPPLHSCSQLLHPIRLLCKGGVNEYYRNIIENIIGNRNWC